MHVIIPSMAERDLYQESIQMVGVCTGTDPDNPALNKLGHPTFSGTIFDCNNLVTGTGNKCKALVPAGEDVVPYDLPNCFFLEAVSPAVSKEEEIEPGILTIETVKGVLTFDEAHLEILASPLLPEGHDPVSVTLTEGGMLATLIKNQGKVLTRRQIHSAIHENDTAYFDDRTINVHKQRLSSKLGENNEERKVIIEIVRGVGYTIKKPKKSTNALNSNL